MTILQILFWSLFAIGLGLILRRIFIGDYPDIEKDPSSRFSEAVLQSIKKANQGMRAYEMALSLGFVGTEEEWLKTIKDQSLELTDEDRAKAKEKRRRDRAFENASRQFHALGPTLRINNSLSWSDEIYTLLASTISQNDGNSARDNVLDVLVEGHADHQNYIQALFGR